MGKRSSPGLLMKSIHIAEHLRLIFPESPVPPEGTVIEVTIPHDEEVRKRLEGKSWTSLTPEVIDSLFGDLILLRHDALRYYIPAFLQRALQSSDVHQIELLVDTLNPRIDQKKDESTADTLWRRAWTKNFENFSEEQRGVIRDFVVWAFAGKGADLDQRVLEYWNRQESSS